MPATDPAIEAILQRNARVEAEKAWETSVTRRLSILLLTYTTAAAFLWSTGDAAPWLHALFPPAGYLLSTLSLPWLKHRWMDRYASGKTYRDA